MFTEGENGRVVGLGWGSSRPGQSHVMVWFAYAAADLAEPTKGNDSCMTRSAMQSFLDRKILSVDGVKYARVDESIGNRPQGIAQICAKVGHHI